MKAWLLSQIYVGWSWMFFRYPTFRRTEIQETDTPSKMNGVSYQTHPKSKIVSSKWVIIFLVKNNKKLCQFQHFGWDFGYPIADFPCRCFFVTRSVWCATHQDHWRNSSQRGLTVFRCLSWSQCEALVVLDDPIVNTLQGANISHFLEKEHHRLKIAGFQGKG